jgi:hypothetical protein
VIAPVEVTAGEEKDAPVLARIRVNEKPGTENFTVIFSGEPLVLPFATATLPVNGTFRKLTADEKRKVEELKQQSPPVTVDFAGGQDNQTALVKLNNSEGRGAKTVIFDINLKLQRH